jgi:hypothetical protein
MHHMIVVQVDAVKGTNEKGWQGGSSGDDKVWSIAVHPTSGDGQYSIYIVSVVTLSLMSLLLQWNLCIDNIDTLSIMSLLLQCNAATTISTTAVSIRRYYRCC